MTLYVVATPIGNLKDISFRALEVLRTVDFILCEDTRRTRKLLSHYNIHRPLISYHQHSDRKTLARISNLVEEGKDLALVTDAGTPGISDPGGKLIEFLIDKNIKIIPIPGPAALTTALSVSGVSADKFVFLGFPPAKRGRRKFFKDLKESNEGFTTVLYESPHRFLRTIDELTDILGKNKTIIIGRELTKIHEEIFRGALKNVRAHFRGRVKGEFVLIFPRVD